MAPKDQTKLAAISNENKVLNFDILGQMDMFISITNCRCHKSKLGQQMKKSKNYGNMKYSSFFC